MISALAAGAAGGGVSLGALTGVVSGLSQASGAFGIGSNEKRPRWEPWMRAWAGPSDFDSGKFNSLRHIEAQQIKDGITATVNTYRRLGLSPLAMGGGSIAGSSPTAFMPGNSSDFDPNQFGAGIERATAAGQTRMQRKLDALLLEREMLTNDHIKLQILGARKALINTSLPPAYDSGVPESIQSKDLTIPERYARVEGTTGVADGIEQLHKMGVDEHGQQLPVYNEKLGDNEVMQFVHAFRYTIPQMLHNMMRRNAKAPLKKTFKSTKNYSKKAKPQRDKVYKRFHDNYYGH
jgi:hypothetical protein